MATYLHADPRRRTNVRFPGPEGELSGHLYRPPSLAADQRTPGVAMCGPISSVKEQTLPHYAERFADAGYTALTFDPTSFGESTGEPRARYRPARVIDDFAYAVDHLMSRSDIDPQRVAVVGVCMGGGYAVSLAAQEKRIRAVVSIAGGYDIGGTFQANLGVEGFADYLRSVNQLVHDGAMAGTISYVPTATPGPMPDHPIAAMPNQEAFDYYERTSHEDAPAWSRELTADSLPAYLTYNAVAAAPLVAPIPLLVIHGTRDDALLPEYAQAVHDAAHGEDLGGTKHIEWVETDNHVQLYDQEPYVDHAVELTLDWLDTHVKARP